ncbi:hypothetical protein [Nocardia suismassiliense]|uniref:hypothetical protein n=1 Tax=Nocardia suismassiliense TaxID=2077092 RepID=UPI000D1D64BA|nr:hypothetical protein [Nocardia suismassiliense]
MTNPSLAPARHRWVAVIGLMLLSPIAAEYLIGYDSGINRPLELLGGLLILGPLYGTVAVLIREVARRTGRGWPTMLLLATAFALAQAGLIDQALFGVTFGPDDPAWATEQPTTMIPVIGVNAADLVNFISGHVVWSFAAPIAVMEACAPHIATRPWLGKPGIVAMVVLYGLAAVLVYIDTTDDSLATPARLVGTAVVIAALVTTAFAIRRPLPEPTGVETAPPWWVVGGLALVVFTGTMLLPTTWLWVTVYAAALAVLAILLLTWSRRAGWSRGHVLAVAGAALVARGGLSFLVEPLGGVTGGAKYLSNAMMLAVVLVLIGLGARRLRRAEPNSC